MNKERELEVVTRITRFVTYEEVDSYIEVHFEMPAGIECVRVSIEVEALGTGGCVIDLGVKDSNRVRGWSGGARKGFTIGLEKATPGYLPGPLVEGTWSVLLGAYRIPQAGCAVHIEIGQTPESGRWLKGDLHMHTVHSDGIFTIVENARIMEDLGCDFLAMTDHNTYSQNIAYPRETGIVMIPGMELTTNHGHANFLGVVAPVQDFRANSSDQVKERIREARSNGARIVLNHPHCPNCGWEWDWAADYDWVEIWNGPWREANQKTLDWWHEQLCIGRRLIAVGGSDMHRPDGYNRHSMPTTWVYAPSRTVEGILQGIDTGCVFLSFSPDGPILELSLGDYRMGSMVPPQAIERNNQVHLRASILQTGDEVKLISNLGVERSWTIQDERALDLYGTPEGRTFYRAEVWRTFAEMNNKLLAAVSNPIYLS